MPLRCRLERNNPLRRNIICIVKALYRLRPESVQGFLLGNINWSPAAQTTTSVFFHPLCGQKKPPSPRGEGFAAVPLAYPYAREMAICCAGRRGHRPLRGSEKRRVKRDGVAVGDGLGLPLIRQKSKIFATFPPGGRFVGRETRPLRNVRIRTVGNARPYSSGRTADDQ